MACIHFNHFKNLWTIGGKFGGGWPRLSRIECMLCHKRYFSFSWHLMLPFLTADEMPKEI